MVTAKKSTKRGATRSAAKSGPKGKDALTILKEDHEKVRQLLARLERTTERSADGRRKLLQQIEQELKAHSQVEEEIFYPMFLERVKKGDRALYFEAKEEHRALDMILPDLKAADPASEEFTGKAHLLKELVEHHIKEEEREMFSRAKKMAAKEDLIAVGEELRRRKQDILSELRIEREPVAESASARVESAAARRMEWGDEDSVGSDRTMDTDSDSDEDTERPI